MQKRNLFLAAVSGLTLALAMPKPGLWMLSWVGLVPLLAALHNSKVSHSAMYGLIAGLIYYGIIIFWVSIFGYLPWALLVVIESAFLAVFAMVASRLMPSRAGWSGYLLVPAVWSAMQWLRSLGAYSFTWGSLAHIHANTESLIQLGAVTGPWGIDFLICLVNLAMAQALIPAKSKGRFVPVVAVGLLVAVIWAGGTAVMRTRPENNLKVAVIQGNAFQNVVPDSNYLLGVLDTYKRLSTDAAMDKPGIIVWPETVLPVLIDNGYWEREISNIARETGATVVCGGYTMPDDPKAIGGSNGAHFFGADGEKLGVYKKVRLVPFGEFVPLREGLTFLKSYGVRPTDVVPGREHVLVDTEQGRAGVSICFESLFPQISRLETKNGARMLYVLTNDGWFGQTQAARQHMMMAKLRAVENRRYVIRAAATGISAVIDPYGRTVAELGLGKRGVVKASISANDNLTIYTRFGDWFAYSCAVAALAVLLLLRKKQVTAEHNK